MKSEFNLTAGALVLQLTPDNTRESNYLQYCIGLKNQSAAGKYLPGSPVCIDIGNFMSSQAYIWPLPVKGDEESAATLTPASPATSEKETAAPEKTVEINQRPPTTG